METDLIINWINLEQDSQVFYYDPTTVIGLFHKRLFVIYSDRSDHKSEFDSGIICFQAHTLTQAQFKFEHFDANHSAVLHCD